MNSRPLVVPDALFARMVLNVAVAQARSLLTFAASIFIPYSLVNSTPCFYLCVCHCLCLYLCLCLYFRFYVTSGSAPTSAWLSPCLCLWL